MTGYTFSQLIDFTRTSAATYVNSAGNIVSTPASVNLLTYTQEFDNGFWVKGATAVTTNTTAAPDGTNTADKLAATNTGAALRSLYANLSPALTATSYAFSFYAKASEYSLVRTADFASSRFFASFDLSNGTVVAGTTGGSQFVSASISAVGNGWHRCVVIFNGTAAFHAPTIIGYPVGATLTDFGANYAGDGTSGIYLWGAQLELGSTASTYTRNFGGLFPARFDYDPVTLAPRGLLVEEQRTNLLLRSEEFDNASWTKTAVTATANATTSPDGTADADKLVETAVTSTFGVTQSATVTAGQTLTGSVYFKAGERQFGWVLIGGASWNAYAAFNLSTGVAGSTTGNNSTGISASIIPAGNGWYRCSVTATPPAGLTSANITIATNNSIAPNDNSYAGSAGSGIFIWGAQLEAGAFATSYIPTTASQVTRAADTATINAPNFASWYNQSEGSLVVEGSAYAFPAASSNNAIAALSDGTTANSHYVYAFGSAGYAATQVSSVVQANPTSGSALSVNTPYKMAYGYKTNDFAFTVNGATVGTDASGTVPTVNQLQIGRVGSTILLNGWVRSIRFYPVRLTNAQLQALTA